MAFSEMFCVGDGIGCRIIKKKGRPPSGLSMEQLREIRLERHRERYRKNREIVLENQKLAKVGIFPESESLVNGGSGSRRNREFKKNHPEEWKQKTFDRMKISGIEWRKKSRFKIALKSSRNAASERGYLPCSASVAEIEAAFTGFCHNPGCNAEESSLKHRLHMDHDHETGKFRGWLCRSCNLATGKLGDSKKIIRGLCEYLEGKK